MRKDILIFRTNIATASDLLAVKPVLDAHHQIEQWNVDQADVDCVLRVVSSQLDHAAVIRLIAALRYECEELNS